MRLTLVEIVLPSLKLFYGIRQIIESAHGHTLITKLPLNDSLYANCTTGNERRIKRREKVCCGLCRLPTKD